MRHLAGRLPVALSDDERTSGQVDTEELEATP